ncbi:hypothetical protein K0504_05355 [Neiella marina]|uniref:Uncharacterized protein n=1 Tax=Neiella holothuriorum TaxID=2870530 RepID=A0ABS7EDP1_9GAMM|nr:hypothetical protein [Neiella holothuriorum]MBW8190457.1 hypothetical protein [Neiella holothuriorum]
MANIENNSTQIVSSECSEPMADAQQGGLVGIQAHDAKQKALAHGLVNDALASLSAELPSPPFSN